jgi:hypothetical protein
MPLNGVIARLADSSGDGLPVSDDHGRHVGTVNTEQIEQAMRDNALDATAGELAQRLPELTPAQTLESALGSLTRAGNGLPVRAPGDETPSGWLTHTDVLHAYNNRLEQGLKQSQQHRRRADAPRAHTRAELLRARLRGYRIVDLELASGQPPVGQRINDLGWPANTRILAIRRADTILPTQENHALEPGDRITLLVPAEAANTLIDTITPRP